MNERDKEWADSQNKCKSVMSNGMNWRQITMGKLRSGMMTCIKVAIAILMPLCGAFADENKPVMESVMARQRYPWNGLVDVVVTFKGAAEDVSKCECVFAATNSVTKLAISVKHITSNGTDLVSDNVCVQKFIWDAAADVGSVKIEDVALTVTTGIPLSGVQLWENGPYWAECNVGATKPEESGYYFMWGDTVGYKRNGDKWVAADGSNANFSFKAENCPTYDMTADQLLSAGYIDSTDSSPWLDRAVSRLLAKHDAAAVHLGAPWRMPTGAELNAFETKCDMEWKTRNGVYGCLLKGKGSYASKSIFLPAVGMGEDSNLRVSLADDQCGAYWSSSIAYEEPDVGYPPGRSIFLYFTWRGLSVIYFGNSLAGRHGATPRFNGCPVRPVHMSVAGMYDVTTHLALDCRTGDRVSAGIEELTFSNLWNGGSESTVTIAQDGAAILTGLTGEGVKTWSVRYDGRYELTHTTYANGVKGKVETAVFVVERMNIPVAELTIDWGQGSFVYDGQPKMPIVDVKHDGKTLTKDIDYAVSYSDNVNAGTARVIVEGRGRYAGSVANTFKITKGTLPPDRNPDPVDPDPVDPLKPFSGFDYVGAYDGAPHTIKMNELISAYTAAVGGAVTVSYVEGEVGTPPTTGWNTIALTYTDIGTNVVWYKVSSANYEDIVHVAKVAIIEPPRITGVTARQRYPWNGLVDIAVTIQGAAEDVAKVDCAFIATNNATKSEISVAHITRNGMDSGSGSLWVRNFIWDAAADVGAVKIDDVLFAVVTKIPLNGVQLWENGPYWAECNVGATKPEESGYYFMWGDTVGYKRNGDKWVAADGSNANFSFKAENCATYDMTADQLLSAGYIDSTASSLYVDRALNHLLAKHDAATAHLGAPWRMPTGPEIYAIKENCDAVWTTRNGVYGCLVQGRGSYASRSIFLPAAGMGSESNLLESWVVEDGRCGNYWSSSIPAEDPDFGYPPGRSILLYFTSRGIAGVYFGGGYAGQRWVDWRFMGCSVRPVRMSVAGMYDATTHLALDCRMGTRGADTTERICFSPVWETAVDGAVATVTLNGVAVTNTTEAGVFEWTPSCNGTYEFAHAVSVGGTSIGETLRATFVVEGKDGTYTEMVDGVEWTYTIKDGVATVGDGTSARQAVPADTQGEITIPSMLGGCPVTGVGDSAFYDCWELTSVTIPSSVTSIGDYAFYECSGLSSMTIPEGVTSIGDYAFCSCSGLTSVTIPSSVTSIGNCAFGFCSGLMKFVVDSLNENYSLINGLLCSKDGRTLLFGVNGDVTIPSSVTSIGDCAFAGYSGLASVMIPSSVTHIGNAAFWYCSGLASVTIPEGVTNIGNQAFEQCSGLTSVTIPSSVTSIGDWTFYYCCGLASVTIPEGVTNIGKRAFSGCYGLTSMTIPSSVISIGEHAFSSCDGLTSVTIPSSVTSIGDWAFGYCYGLTLVTIPSSVMSIGDRAFYDCRGLNSIVFEGNAPTIGVSCFSSVSSSCVVSVRHGSAGWGVNIPGKWNGLNIAYTTPIDAGGGVTVNVPDSWMEPYGGYTKVNDNGANGLPYWQSYVLGLDPTDEESKVELAAPKDDDPDKIELGLNINVPEDAGVTPTYALMKDGVKVSDELVIDLSGEGDPTGIYTVSVKIGTSEIPVEQTIGVQKGQSTMTKTAISVPWGRLNGGGPVTVAELVKTANLTVGDKLHIYNKSAKRYETWELDADKVWQPLATYLINADGSVSTVSAGKPTDTTVKRGSAVWLERQDPTKPYYLYGGYEADEIETEVEAGSAAEPSWNLIAAPSIEPFDLNRIEGADARDQIMVTTEAGPVVYTFKGGAWGCDVNVTEKRKGPGGVEIEVVKRVRDTEHATIPAGVGFWYVSQGGKPVIKW